MMMQDREETAARAQSQRLAELKLKASDHLVKRALDTVSGDTVKTRYVLSDLTDASLKNRIAINKLNLTLRRSLTFATKLKSQ